MRRYLFSIIVSIALLPMLAGCNIRFSTTPDESLPPIEPGTEVQQREAFEAARSIVKALDRGEFGAVWEASSRQLKDTAGKTVFTTLMSTTRKSLGKPAPRGAPRGGFTSKVDAQGPEGEYAVLWVDTDFGGKTVTEKVVMVKESGQWKLAGYFMNTKL